MVISQKRENLLKYLATSKKIHILSIILVGVVLYWNTLDNQMFWDDDDFILNNAYIKNWKYIPKYFTENLIAGSGLVSDYWRPLLMLVFSFQWSLWQDWTTGYHLTNLVFHISCGILLYKLISSLFSKPQVALLVSIIFIAHPVQTEAVAYANSLGDSLSVFIILLSLRNFYIYVTQKNKQSGKWLKSITYYALALLAKETAIVGVLLALLIYVKEKKLQKFSLKYFIDLLKICWGHLLVFSVYITLRATTLNFKNTFNLYNETNEFTSNILVRILTFLKILFEYLVLLFFPTNLHMERSLAPANSLFEPKVFIGFLCLITFIGFGVWAYIKKQVLIWFGIAWFFICLIPTSNILIPINGLLYEHWLYTPIIGFSVFISGLLILILNRYNNVKLKALLATIGAVYLMFFSYKTIQRNQEWENPVLFYEQTLKYSPNNYRIINNLGMEYADIGENDKAIEKYKEAIAILPNNAVAYHNLANAYKEKGETRLAEQNFKKALELDNNFLFSKRGLVKLYLDNKDLNSLEILIIGKNPSTEDYFLMYQLAYELEEYSKAYEFIMEAEKKNPKNPQILEAKRKLYKLISP